MTSKFYFYACGSIPNRGQTFAVKAVESYLRHKKPKYAALADVKQFYKSVKKEHVMRCLRRVFKDERFLLLNERILDQMDGGLAIGFTVSHWYAHLVLSSIDKRIKEQYPSVFLVRFMDNYVFLNNRKRTLHNVIDQLMYELGNFDLCVKQNWQVFQVKYRMVEFLSYRLDHHKTILRKKLMYRMCKRFKRAKKKLDAHNARVIMSYRGILSHCDSYNFRVAWLYPNVSLSVCRRLISNADKKRTLCGTA